MALLCLVIAMVAATDHALGASPTAWAVGTYATASRNPRIVNGVPTQDYPSVGVLLIESDDGGISTNCSATLVGCQTVVTAAHCFCDDSERSLRDCLEGDWPEIIRRRSAFFLQNGGGFAIAAVALHPSYEFTQGGDIAVLTLDRPVERIVPAFINDARRPRAGDAGTIVGFGISGGASTDSGVKRVGSVRLTSCIGPANPDTHLCWHFDNPVGPVGQDSNTCHGDSGGPLFTNSGNGLTLAGVTSGGLPTCLQGADSYDTDIFVYQEWIRSVAGNDLGRTCGDAPVLGQAGSSALAASRFVDTLSPVVLDPISVPPGTSELRIVQNGTDNWTFGNLTFPNHFSLYVRRGQAPDADTFDCRSEVPGTYGYCAFSNPQAGNWYIQPVVRQGFGIVQVSVSLFGSLSTPTRILTSSRTQTATRTGTRTVTRTVTSTPIRTSTRLRTHTPVPTATITQRHSETPIRSRTPTPAASSTRPTTHDRTPTSTDTRTPTRTLAPTQPIGPCRGDCSDDGDVTIDELIKGVNIALDLLPVDSCARFDSTGDGQVTIDEIVLGVVSALRGCVREGTRTAIASLPPSPTATVTPRNERSLECNLEGGSEFGIQTGLTRIPLPARGIVTLTGINPSPDHDFEVTIKSGDFQIQPIAVPGAACVCIRGVADPEFGPGNMAKGHAYCDGMIQTASNYIFSMDHNVNDIDPECLTSGARIDPKRPGVCIGPLTVTKSGQAPRGFLFLESTLSVTLIQDGGLCNQDPKDPKKGPDGIPCTGDDPNQAKAIRVPLITGEMTGVVLDVNNSLGQDISPDQRCGDRRCQTQMKGMETNCSELESGSVAGFLGSTSIVTAIPQFYLSDIGDVVITARISCQ